MWFLTTSVVMVSQTKKLVIFYFINSDNSAGYIEKIEGILPFCKIGLFKAQRNYAQ